jgi:hypothetical protein
MALQLNTNALCPAASSAVQNYTGFATSGAADRFGVQVRATAGTTFTFKFQGAFDPSGVSDANANWSDISFYDASVAGSKTTFIAADTVTTTTVKKYWLSDVECYNRIRLVVTANTGMTFSFDVVEGTH